MRIAEYDLTLRRQHESQTAEHVQPDTLPRTASVDGLGDMRDSPDGRSDCSVRSRPIMRRVGLVPFWQDEPRPVETNNTRDSMRTKRRFARPRIPDDSPRDGGSSEPLGVAIGSFYDLSLTTTA